MKEESRKKRKQVKGHCCSPYKRKLFFFFQKKGTQNKDILHKNIISLYLAL